MRNILTWMHSHVYFCVQFFNFLAFFLILWIYECWAVVDEKLSLSLSVCMCANVCVCVCVHMYTYIYICVCACVCVNIVAVIEIIYCEAGTIVWQRQLQHLFILTVYVRVSTVVKKTVCCNNCHIIEWKTEDRVHSLRSQ